MTDTKFTFTKARLDRLPIPTGPEAGSAGYVVYRDEQVDGLYLLVRPSGAKTFVLRYRTAGREKRVTVGKYGRLTVEQARAVAKRLNGQVALGGDPAADKKEVRQAASWTDLFDRYLTVIEGRSISDHTPRSIRRVKTLIADDLGSRSVVDTDETRITALLEPMKVQRGVYNICLTYIRAAVRWGKRSRVLPKTYEDPTDNLRLLPSIPQGRRIVREEYRAILTELDRMVADSRHDAARVLAILWVVFTGCRPIDAARLRRDEVKRARGIAELATHKTMMKTGPKTFFLTPQLLDLLDRAEALHKLRKIACEFVFPRASGEKASQWLAKTWAAVKAATGLDIDLRQMRSGYINAADDAGLTFKQIAEMTGHASEATIKRHYHEVEMKRAAKNAARNMDLIESSKVVDLDEERKARAS